MGLKALLYAYLLGGVTFIPLVIAGIIFYSLYTAVPPEEGTDSNTKKKILTEGENGDVKTKTEGEESTPLETDDLPRTRKGWLIVRRTFEESPADGGYVGMMRSFLDARSKDPKRSRPKDTWYVALKGKVLYLYEDETMTDCEAAIELGGHDVVIYPEELLDGELFTKRNAICLKPKVQGGSDKAMPSVTKAMKLNEEETDEKLEQAKEKGPSSEKAVELEKKRAAAAREQALNASTPWFIFVKSCYEMEDWYLALIHASDNAPKTPYLEPVDKVFKAADMNHLVTTLDEQPDVIPTRWLNALIGRIFFSFYRTDMLESYFIGRLMKKLSKVKRPAFLADIVVTEVNVGNRAPTFSKPMLKELTKEGDAAMEVHFHFKGEFRITIQATAVINLGAFNKSYTVKLVLAAVIREIEGNLLVKLKRPPSNRIWYAFTQTPKMSLSVEPIVSDRQITWGMILGTIESQLKQIIQESVVLPNMDDIAFFDSLPYSHRGGIWSDAARMEGPRIPVTTTTTTTSTTSTQPIDDAQPSMSMPTVSVDASVPSEEKVVPAQTSHSAEELVTAVVAEKVTPTVITTSPTEDAALAAKAEPELPEAVQNQRNSQRRRSWFSSIKSDTLASLAAQDAEDEGTDDEQRGRTSELEKPTAPRSRSSPANPDSPTTTTTAEVGQPDQIQDEDRVIPRVHLRSASVHSTKSGHTKNKSIDSSISAPDSTDSSSSKSQISTQTSPSSFLSTLKTRAADKQALSNTAREAMRKWGMNWGAKKDTGSGGEDSDRGSIGSTIGSRLRSDNNQTFAQKARASYAEVWAAVEERRNKPASNAGDDSSDRDISRSSSPIAVPENPRIRATSNPWQDTSTTSSATSPGPSSYPESVSLSNSTSSSNGSGGHSTQGDNSGSTSVKSPTPVSRAVTEGDDQTKQAPSAIVQLQPKGKTMTIPGIHASHRGEVMSMGYNAPPQPPSNPPADANKASILRLFKSPTANGEQSLMQQQQSSTLRTEAMSAEVQIRPETLTAENSTSSSASTPKTHASAPPPLPPRTPAPASGLSKAAAEHTRSQATSGGISSASDALRSIASKDNVNRAAISAPPSPPTSERSDSNDAVGSGALSNQKEDVAVESPLTSPISNPGPPLPPRRTQTLDTQS